MSKEIIKDAIKEFGKFFNDGLESIKKACKIYVDAIDYDPTLIDKFREEYPNITESAWVRFEQVGRGLLHESLLTDYSMGAKKLKNLPYSQQEKFSKNGIELLTKTNDILKVEVSSLTKEQVKQVFTNDHVRTLAEQRAYIESQETYNAKPVDDVPYMIKNKKLFINQKGIFFTLQQLKDIIKDMEK